jgi:hypothetical protein
MTKASVVEKPSNVAEPPALPPIAVSARTHIVIFKREGGWQALEGAGGIWERPMDPPFPLAMVVERFLTRLKTCDLTITHGPLNLSEIDENVFPMRDLEVCLRKPGDNVLWQNYCWDNYRQRASLCETFAKVGDRVSEILPEISDGKGWLSDFWIRQDLTAAELFPVKA